VAGGIAQKTGMSKTASNAPGVTDAPEKKIPDNIRLITNLRKSLRKGFRGRSQIQSGHVGRRIGRQGPYVMPRPAARHKNLTGEPVSRSHSTSAGWAQPFSHGVSPA